MSWILANLDLIGELALVHLRLAVPPIVLAFLMSVPIGWVAWRYAWSRGVLLSVIGLIYAIPSLPLFVALPAILGTSRRSELNVVIALTLYGIALMVRSAADGFGGVDRDIRQSATGVGFSAWRRFWQVELPLAGPVLLAGLRVVAVSTVSLVTVGAVIGVQSLGSLFTDGFQRGIQAEIWAGILATMLLAFAIDGLLVVAGRLVMPWTRAGARSAGTRRTGRKAVAA